MFASKSLFFYVPLSTRRLLATLLILEKPGQKKIEWILFPKNPPSQPGQVSTCLTPLTIIMSVSKNPPSQPAPSTCLTPLSTNFIAASPWPWRKGFPRGKPFFPAAEIISLRTSDPQLEKKKQSGVVMFTFFWRITRFLTNASSKRPILMVSSAAVTSLKCPSQKRLKKLDHK